MADLGCVPLCPELARLRLESLRALKAMAEAVWPDDVLAPVPSGKELDSVLLRIQSDCSKRGFNNVWAEKARLQAKSALLEQWKRAQRNLFGRLKHISTVGDTPMEDGTPRLVNLPEEFSRTLSEADVSQLQELADGLDFKQAMKLFQDLKVGDANLPGHHATALRAMADIARQRYGIPQWNDEAVVQLHLDYRCIRGGKDVLGATLQGLGEALRSDRPNSDSVPLTSVSPRGDVISLPLNLIRPVIEKLGGQGSEGQRVVSLVLEIGQTSAQAKMVVVRPPVARPVAGHRTVVSEDFGYANTSSMTVLRSTAPISQERVDFALSNPGEKLSKQFLESCFSRDEVELLETLQFDGADFMGRIMEQAKKVDRLRSEIDLVYNRMARIRREMNLVAGNVLNALVPLEIPEGILALDPERTKRYADMHRRFFKGLAHVVRLKEIRRAVYRAVAGLKKAWFGHVANRKAELAEKHEAVVASEGLSLVAIPLDDPAYKGRTFNRMFNNGSKGQYSRRSENTLKWRGIPSIKVPSFWTSSYDWWNGTVDKAQRKGKIFTAKSNGRVWDADLHAAETIGRYLFLRSKAETAALAA
jgi:hypothetical protein